MREIKAKMYQCEICGGRFFDKQKAEWCERDHISLHDLNLLKTVHHKQSKPVSRPEPPKIIEFIDKNNEYIYMYAYDEWKRNNEE